MERVAHLGKAISSKKYALVTNIGDWYGQYEGYFHDSAPFKLSGE